eukprot:2305262-Prymnesium_polylepis.1
MFIENNFHRTRGGPGQPVYANGTLAVVVGAQVATPQSVQHLLSGWLQLQGSYLLPVVQMLDGNQETYALEPIEFYDKVHGHTLVALPIAQASAITIDKSLGMTLPAAVVDFTGLRSVASNRSFVDHLVYEALSRCE